MQEKIVFHGEGLCQCCHRHPADQDGLRPRLHYDQTTRCQWEQDVAQFTDSDASGWLSPLSSSGWHRSLAHRYSVHARTLTE